MKGDLDDDSTSIPSRSPSMVTSRESDDLSETEGIIDPQLDLEDPSTIQSSSSLYDEVVPAYRSGATYERGSDSMGDRSSHTSADVNTKVSFQDQSAVTTMTNDDDSMGPPVTDTTGDVAIDVDYLVDIDYPKPQPDQNKTNRNRDKTSVLMSKKGQKKPRRKKKVNKLVTEALADLGDGDTSEDSYSSSEPGDTMDNPDITENVVEYPAFEYFKCEILGSDVSATEALKHVDVVTQQLNSELCGTMLVPFLAEAQRNMPVHLLRMLPDVWHTLSKITNQESYICAIIDGVSFLISQEDPSIRRKAVELIAEIVTDVRSSECTYDVMKSAVMPLLKRLSESEWFADVVSACNLIPLVYPDASAQDQVELRECYKQLWESNLTIVRLEVARNLEKLLAIMHMDDSVSMFWLVLKNMSVYHQDQVRAHCVDACLSFARRCTAEQNLSFSYPVIMSAASDSSWRVRKALAERYDKIHEILGESEMEKHFLEVHFELLNDSEDIVKEAAVNSFVTWCKALSPKMAERYIAFFQSHLAESSTKIRQCICNIFAIFASGMTRERVCNVLGPMLRNFLQDECTDVRLCAINNIEVLCEPGDFDTGIGSMMNETIARVLLTTHWRHRLILAEKLTAFYRHFGPRHFDVNFSRLLFRLLLDNVWKVRSTVLCCIELICAGADRNWVCDTILKELVKIYVEPRNSIYISVDDIPLSYAFKITVIQALIAVAKSLDAQSTLPRIIPVMLKGIKDTIPNVRFVAIKAIRSLFLIYKDDAPEQLLHLRSVFLKLREDPDIDVRYYAKVAIDTYDSCFPSD
ncbi:hypothetical protein BBOV_II001110 [Babesia bovis T2Bo]|uniref:hypothetical protein n=1 Tax=Babesia bovis T2Bo TaxID=484906 RepID=UPI001C3562B8|nr:hypothetical protein BBOV_II001110 [Babesia bovis T2Bo]EDO06070.2 hypothetical protein BBOV_II001110 [Babesia bovis T2Bo]